MQTKQREVFNFETAYGGRGIVKFLFFNYRKPVTEEQFVDLVNKVKQPGRSKRYNHNHTPSQAKRLYRHLRERYGFFSKEAVADGFPTKYIRPRKDNP